MIDTKLLKELALYLEGFKEGKGNLLPLGDVHLWELWKVIGRVEEINEQINKEEL